MRRCTTIAIALGLLLACTVSGTAAAGPSAVAVNGLLEVGKTLDCTPDSGTGFLWYHADDLSTPISSDPTYTASAADVGHRLVCSETPQGASSPTTSDPSPPVAPEPAITVTLGSPAVSGNIGEAVPGVEVVVTLERHDFFPDPHGGFEVLWHTDFDAARATASTDASGAWSASLESLLVSGRLDGLQTDTDILHVTYAPPAGGDVVVPPDTSYDTQPSDEHEVLTFPPAPSVSADGSRVSLGGPCDGVSILVDRAPGDASGGYPTTANGPNCEYAPAALLTDANHVQAVDTATFDPDLQGDTPGDVGPLSIVSAAVDGGLLGAGSGPPTCSAELASHLVSCGGLNDGTFALTRTRDNTSVSLVPAAGSPGSASAPVPGLAAGDVLTLDETGPVVTSRHLTTLHVSTYTFAAPAADGTTPATCSPGLAIRESSSYDQYLCPASGAVSLPNTAEVEIDDLSGGSTATEVPPSQPATSLTPVGTAASAPPVSSTASSASPLVASPLVAPGASPAPTPGGSPAAHRGASLRAQVLALARCIVRRARGLRGGAARLCRVAVGVRGARTVSVTVARAGHVCVSGVARVRRGRVRLRLHAVRRERAGRYTITIVVATARSRLIVRWVHLL